MNGASCLRLISYRAFLAPQIRAINVIQCRAYATKPTDSKSGNTKTKKLHKNPGRSKEKAAAVEEEDVEENALSALDELTASANQALRHQHKNPIPDAKQTSEINEDAARRRDLSMRQEQMRVKKAEIVKRVRTLATMDTSELEEPVTYGSIEEAYASLKEEFDVAHMEQKADELYEVITSMRSMGLRLPKKDYDAAAVMFAQQQQIYKVTDMWEFMSRDQVFADQESFMKVVAVYSDMAQYEWAMKSFLKMCEYICPNSLAYEEAMDLFSRNSHIGNLRKAEMIFHTIHRFDVKHTPKGCASFIKLLCASGYEGDADRAVEILKYMKAKVIGPVPDDVPQYFVTHLNKYAVPEHLFIRTKKVLRGCQHGGLPDAPFKGLWDVVNSKKYLRKIHRADMAAPIEKMDFSRTDNKDFKLGTIVDNNFNK